MDEKKIKPSIGRNRFLHGFTEANGYSHWNKHKSQYPGMTVQDYVDEALKLIQSPCGGSIRGYARENGQIVRFNALTNDYVVGYNDSDGGIPYGIATMYKIDERVYERKLKEEAFGDDYY